MTARILVVDDNANNRTLFQAMLAAEYYDVVSASGGEAALAAVAERPPDLILLDVMMPDIGGYEVCRRLKADRRFSHIPVVMATALDSPQDMVRGLESGADDFLTKPVDDLALFTRVRSLVRLKRVLDEWRLREGSVMEGAGPEALADEPVAGARLLAFTESSSVRRTLASVARRLQHELDFRCGGLAPAEEAALCGYDLILAELGAVNFDALRICSQARSNEATRHLPFVLIGTRDSRALLFKGLDLGANEYLLRPLNRNEVTARLTTQVRRHRLQRRIQHRHPASLDQAMHDGLTGLYNRHYLEAHLPRLHAQAVESGRPLSLIVCDLDHFKALNDTQGHVAGDAALRAVAKRMAALVRAPDLVARFGGEEFLIVLPGAVAEDAAGVAERLREAIAATPLPVPGHALAFPVTASFGVSAVQWDESSPEAALRRADAALYRAKRQGRNCVAMAGAGRVPTLAEAEASAARRAV